MMEKEEKKQSNTAIKAVAGTLIILVLVMVLFFIGDVLFSFKDVDSRGEFKTLLLNYAIVYMYGNHYSQVQQILWQVESS